MNHQKLKLFKFYENAVTREEKAAHSKLESKYADGSEV
jgi:hypothetical protein